MHDNVNPQLSVIGLRALLNGFLVIVDGFRAEGRTGCILGGHSGDDPLGNPRLFPSKHYPSSLYWAAEGSRGYKEREQDGPEAPADTNVGDEGLHSRRDLKNRVALRHKQTSSVHGGLRV